MDWRALLEITEINDDLTIRSQITQNTHFEKEQFNCAYSVDSVAESPEQQSKINEIVGDAIIGISITNEDVIGVLSNQEKIEILDGQISKKQISALAESIKQKKLMCSGIRPEHYKYHATCQQCGPICCGNQ